MSFSVNFDSDVSAAFINGYGNNYRSVIAIVSDVTYYDGTHNVSSGPFFDVSFTTNFYGSIVSIPITITKKQLTVLFPLGSTFSSMDASYSAYSSDTSGTTFSNITVKMTDGTLYTGGPDTLKITSNPSSNSYTFLYVDTSTNISYIDTLTFSGGGTNTSVFTLTGYNYNSPQQEFYICFFFGIYTILAQALSINAKIDYISIGTVFMSPLLSSPMLFPQSSTIYS